jgi:hypothetical protein
VHTAPGFHFGRYGGKAARLRHQFD